MGAGLAKEALAVLVRPDLQIQVLIKVLVGHTGKLVRSIVALGGGGGLQSPHPRKIVVNCGEDRHQWVHPNFVRIFRRSTSCA